MTLDQSPTPALLAGAARVDITAPAGTHLAGDTGRYQPAQGVADRLYASAMVLETADGVQTPRRICLLSLDATFVSRDATSEIRDEAARRWGFDRDSIMVHATQTHSAPPVGRFLFDDDFTAITPELEWLRGGERLFTRLATGGAVRAIGEAVEALRPARIGAGSAIQAGLAFNRRAIVRGGRAEMPWPYSRRERPLGATHVRYMEGPADHEVGVLCVRDDRMDVVGMLLSFTCHPVNMYYHRTTEGARPIISSDWPGTWAESVRSFSGDGSIPVVLNGACGNINPWPAFEPDFKPDHRRMGRTLADATERTLDRLDFTDTGRIDFRTNTIHLPLRKVDAQQLGEAQKMIERHPVPLRQDADPARINTDWYGAAMTVSLDLEQRRDETIAYEIQVLRIGDTAFVGLPGEPFVEGQLRIKTYSPANLTYVVHATSQFVGYIATREAFAHGGHEVNHSWWAKLEPDALDTIVDEVLAILRDMFG
jgi:hypothetical protein